MLSVPLAVLIVILASIGTAYVLALDDDEEESRKAKREKLKLRRPRMHRMITCFPCACGWCALGYVAWGRVVFVLFGMAGLEWMALALAAPSGLGVGVLCSMYGGK